MKKTFLIAVAIIVIVASLPGCNTVKSFFAKKTEPTVGEKVNDEKIPLEGAKMEYVSSTSHSLTVRIENSTASTWQSGNMRDYQLEVEMGGEWYVVTQTGELANTMELMIFAPGDAITHTFEFTNRYGELAPGKYRVVKSWWANATENTAAGEFHLVCEFCVE